MALLAVLALFIIVPLAELYVILQVGEAIGAPATIALLAADSILGWLLMRSQGRTVWRRFQAAMAEGRVPHREVLEHVLRDPQVTTPAPSYDPGSHSKKSRRRGQPAPTVPIPHGGTNPGPDVAEAQPAPTRTGLGFSRSATIPR